MTDYLLGLVPDYGLILIFFSVAIACLAVPLPASMLVVASGGFAAAGDFEMWQALTVALVAYVFGDQAAYLIARTLGPPLVNRLKSIKELKPMIASGEALIERRGQSAVFISHTILSPVAPYVTYISGAGNMPWGKFTIAAVPGAAVWATVYVLLGYAFASQLPQLNQMLGSFVGIVVAAAVILLSALWLRKRWVTAHASHG
jgi:membrane protein DedA with SNARE-associated domain